MKQPDSTWVPISARGRFNARFKVVPSTHKGADHLGYDALFEVMTTAPRVSAAEIHEAVCVAAAKKLGLNSVRFASWPQSQRHGDYFVPLAA